MSTSNVITVPSASIKRPRRWRATEFIPVGELAKIPVAKRGSFLHLVNDAVTIFELDTKLDGERCRQSGEVKKAATELLNALEKLDRLKGQTTILAFIIGCHL